MNDFNDVLPLLFVAMATPPGRVALNQNIFQQIINVHWGGLAVEFGNRDRDAGEEDNTA